jgi:glycosyltransferase involved in cell wall biosynthesis
MILSVLIPVYNEGKTIRKVIDAVKKADTGNIRKEIVVVDDGSKDNTLTILKQIKGI